MLINKHLIVFKREDDLNAFYSEYDYLFDCVENVQPKAMVIYSSLSSDELNEVITIITDGFLVIQLDLPSSDEILDKVSEIGFNNVPEIEKMILHQS